MNTHSENIKIECAEDCGNSPKKLLLKDFTISFAKNEMGFCLEWLRDDVIWDIIGKKKIQGKDDVEIDLRLMKEKKVQELQIENIITHGNTASVNGTMVTKNKERIAFCDIYNFGGFGKKAKIKAITSYVIQLS